MSKRYRILLLLLGILFCCLSCSSNDNSHTTTTTFVSPPPHQELVVTRIPASDQRPAAIPSWDKSVDPSKPLLHFALEDNSQFRVGEVVPIILLVSNAKLIGEGGDFRVRYIVDDEDMKWLDRSEPFGLQGWVPGKHTIRVELVGPDGWPYRNGNANIVTRQISVR